ncbi:MAG: Threonine-tRNA ligase [Microgenomates group bacterium GW2011_GWC2_46_7]|nr:MAG: Threonine-tRNA ligase [Microgenomates group bacterium GW2011_GWC2_46_7]
MKDQNNTDQLLALRHSAEHVLHQAMKELYPSIRLAMGPATEEGYYFDFDGNVEGEDSVVITTADFPKIEKCMAEIIKKNLPITRHEISEKEARELFADNPYKLEWVDKAVGEEKGITIYWTGQPGEKGSMVDLCKGPHVSSTGEIKAFKLLSVAGAYWHGDEKNKMLTRIYGSAFTSQEALDQYLWQIEEAKKRDHRKLGRELDLFTFSDLVGSGLPLYTARGAFIRRTINDFIESVQSQLAYTQVWTPQIVKAELFKTSGHYDKYKDDMFTVHSHYSDEEFFLKPMNCPQHAEIYKSRPRSYRDLPLRLTDFAMLYRDEKAGELNGLARVRAFSQDDCHVYCREDQVDFEVDMMLQMTKQIMDAFGLKYRYRLSTRDTAHPEKYLGDPKQWDKVEAWAVKIMQRNGIEYYDGPGEAAFYAPKMDLMATDALGREWQLSTVQIDYVQPVRFDLTYTAADGSRQRPVTLHRAIAGSSERLMMVLLEHYAGELPLWLSPTQLILLPISEHELEYTQKLAQSLTQAGFRTEVDESANTLGKKMVRAREWKVPYLAIIGKKEVETSALTLKNRAGEQITLTLEATLTKLQQEVSSKV